MPNSPADAQSAGWRSEPLLDGVVEVLDAVRLAGAGSRTEVARRTRLSRAIVAQRIGELVERGLLIEQGTRPSTGGRPPRQLRFAAETGHLLLVDLGATSIAVALADLSGRITAFAEEPADIAWGPERIIGRVEALLEELRGRPEGAPGRLRGIGVGVPGPVEFRTGRPVAPPIMPGWDGYPIRERFTERYGAPTWVDNDVNILAAGEWRYGIARGHDNVVFIKVGTGIGAGLISDGQLHRGSQGAAGDVGHIGVADHRGVVCRCGNVGCLEALAGGAALARDAEAAARDGRSRLLADVLARDGHVTAEHVGWAAARGDAASVELLQQAGRRIGSMLASIVNFFNPSLIIIGGGVASAGDVLPAAIREVVHGRSLPLATRELSIRRASLGAHGGVMGAAAMVLDELLTPERLAHWDADRPTGRELSMVAGDG
jgi:glucokinase-like ROK family protein